MYRSSFLWAMYFRVLRVSLWENLVANVGSFLANSSNTPTMTRTLLAQGCHCPCNVKPTPFLVASCVGGINRGIDAAGRADCGSGWGGATDTEGLGGSGDMGPDCRNTLEIKSTHCFRVGSKSQRAATLSLPRGRRAYRQVLQAVGSRPLAISHLFGVIVRFPGNHPRRSEGPRSFEQRRGRGTA